MQASVRVIVWTLMAIALVWLAFVLCALFSMHHFPALPVVRFEAAMLGGQIPWALGGGDPRTILLLATILWAVAISCGLALFGIRDRRRHDQNKARS